MSQPKWKLIAQLGDTDPIENGGYFIYEDETGVHDPQGEYLVVNDDVTDADRRHAERHGSPEPGGWIVYRFDLDKCTLTESEPDHDGSTYTVLSDNPFHPLHPVWFADGLEGVASTMGTTFKELRASFCSDDITERASAYRAIGEYHGFENLDDYPLTFTDRAEVEERYDIESDEDRRSKRTISDKGVRQHELSNRIVKCPHAGQYGARAKVGDWIVYSSEHERQYGRMLGRVDAPEMLGEYPSPAINGYLSVLQLSLNMRHAYIRWVMPENVTEVSENPPAKFLAWFTGPMPSAEIVHKLSSYGTLSESYIDHVQHHITAFEAGVSPSSEEDWQVTTNRYEVIVGNIGTVYSGTSLKDALDTFKEYKDQSVSGYGRASGETVTVMKNDEVRWEHIGTQENA